MPETTEILARAFGPFLVVLGLAILLRANHWIPVIARYADDAVVRLTWATVELAAGLLLLAFHNTWSSPAAIIITLLGWLAAIEATLLLLLPERITRAIFRALNRQPVYLLLGSLSIAPGIVLCLAAFG